MRGIGVHVCEGCGAVLDTIGAYLDCAESHIHAVLTVTRTLRGEDVPLLNVRLDPACLSWTVGRNEPVRPRIKHEDGCRCGQNRLTAPDRARPEPEAGRDGSGES